MEHFIRQPKNLIKHTVKILLKHFVIETFTQQIEKLAHQ